MLLFSTLLGSGKTSLLNVLAGRVMKAGKSKLEGQVLVNGRPRDESFKRLSAYVSCLDHGAAACLHLLKRTHGPS